MARIAKPVPFSLMPDDERELAEVMAHLGIASRSQWLRLRIHSDYMDLMRERNRAARQAATTTNEDKQ